ncbi:serine hydrolase domain-containing protein [Streptomyces macrosporus]|uniref:Serine hydrolase domain-containing protein n=1 Tax=Streptomyces macrosporus TaxID=44032 RepID=A0ABP5XGE0_9ACTN
MRLRVALCAGVAALSVCAGTVPAASAPGGARAVPTGGTGSPAGLQSAELQSALDGVHRAGIPGVYAEVRDGGRTWRGASGVADVETGRPVRPGMRQRVGSITKTFTAAAVMQQVERGRIRLDAPIGDYLPHLVPGERGRKVTVRMLLNHTSGISEYLPYAFPSLGKWPSLPDISPESLDDNRFRRFHSTELIEMGLAAPPAGEPGSPTGVYSNTNYLLLGRLLEEVTGTTAEEYITRNVIEPAGLRHTGFPDGPRIEGPHPRMYEALYGLIDPPRDYSVYDMSWVMTGAGLVSTMADLNRFYGRLLDGKVVSRASLAQMRRTVPVRALDGTVIEYGLGLHKVGIPGCGTFWGHDGSAWGAGTVSLTRADGERQMSFAVNLARWNTLDSSGQPRHHPIDDALAALSRQALCGEESAGTGNASRTPASAP